MDERLINGGSGRRSPNRLQFGLFGLAFLLLILFIGIRWGASLLIDYSWWKELGQVDTWLDLYAYSTLPVAAGTIVAWIVLLVAHSRAVKFAGGRVSDYPLYSRLSSLILLFVSFLVADASIDNWTVLRFAGSRTADTAAGFHDPIFGKPVTFYLFDLPFWSDLRGYVFAVLILAILIYWLVARGWQLRFTLPDLMRGSFDFSLLRLSGGLESGFLRIALAIFLIAFSLKFYLGRYEMVWNQHRFMVGIDYTDDHFVLPLYWVMIGALLAAAALILVRRWIVAGGLVGVATVLLFIVPGIAGSLYVKPNEISLERPYIQSHIEATRAAYGLSAHLNEVEMHTNPAATIDASKHTALLDNVRLWDWRPFHDTVTQMQALRPYYAFQGADVDRYMIDGNYRQVLLSPRELDITQLPGTQSSWINPHFIYTHGYGLVLAEVSKITPDGQPVYLVQDMPPEVKTPSLKITRPELYYGELQQEPVFVDTAQEEFDYPRGSDNAKTRYQGKGGFPVSSLLMRAAGALHFGDSNIILTGYLTDHSRMMIHRRVRERLQSIAPYLTWDVDPYLVITPEGRLVWMVDGYSTSDAHPYSREVDAYGDINYIRNSVKATVDAYDGETHLYVFDPSDPVISAYRTLFPKLYENVAAMPEALRAHARYGEELFNVQAQIYRVYHMRNPQSFYNNEDVWELAKYSGGPNTEPKVVTPSYVFATLPGETKPEFLLMTTFTPLSKENLIGVMLARCDGDKLGQVVVLQLSKQELILGPMQINARINQDQNISKDLTLWSQQGSQVLEGQTLVLPVGDTFLYISPLYLAATQARMPQLKKVVLAVGNRLIYADTYEQARAQLNGEESPEPAKAAAVITAASPPPTIKTGDPRIDSIRQHLQRYRDFAGQGKWTEAGRELDAIQNEVQH
ncbi:MAG TPA: UPF0182 family protein [Bryobacteraceae bacterium]|jgi:hypothetical protein|nr:UPF0182 family protein [Bryobacteraceae bacterium]